MLYYVEERNCIVLNTILKRRTKLNEEKRILSTRLGLYSFYKRQLRKFLETGIGNQTEFVTVSQNLIDATKRRLEELKKL